MFESLQIKQPVREKLSANAAPFGHRVLDKTVGLFSSSELADAVACQAVCCIVYNMTASFYNISTTLYWDRILIAPNNNKSARSGGVSGADSGSGSKRDSAKLTNNILISAASICESQQMFL